MEATLNSSMHIAPTLRYDCNLQVILCQPDKYYLYRKARFSSICCTLNLSYKSSDEFAYLKAYFDLV